ncbi:MAG: peptide chain release factor N(5)-glutamine methyltransferase [Trueperaceae bacterium]
MTVQEARVATHQRLAAAGTASPAAETLLLLEEAVSLERTELLLSGDRELTAAERRRLEALVARREAREPLQHVLGRAPFYGLELAVDSRVLVPRPETERLVELVLERLRADAVPDPLVLDVGTGSGAVALAIKNEFPGATVIGTDVSQDALDVAAANAARLGLAVTFARSDLLGAAEAKAAARACAVLVANPPYLPAADAGWIGPEVMADPPLALFGGPSGLETAERLVEEARHLMPAGSSLALELDPRNVQRLRARLGAWQDVEVERDLVGRERFVVARR